MMEPGCEMRGVRSCNDTLSVFSVSLRVVHPTAEDLKTGDRDSALGIR